ncbi:MAG: hypothetical protein KU37_09575 [Sulfuricurvum sp. PC08-66]|nr:MAG: hypothetical protein KU37_09575 [Sulfuricurvum sp. PC08-66]
MARLKITLSYHGASFLGFQVQKNTSQTVAGALYAALEHLKISARITASGRTDTGVHATRQVLHIDVPSYWHNLGKLTQSLNHHLPPTIRIRRIEQVDESFHARFGAIRRRYRYILCEASSSPFDASTVTYIDTPLDTTRMHEALCLFEGTHDFAYFQKFGNDAGSTVRTISRTRLYRRGRFVIITIEGNAFLRSQIRMIVQTLLLYNSDKITLDAIRAQLAKEAMHSRRLAPPNGLYLTDVFYPSRTSLE